MEGPLFRCGVGGAFALAGEEAPMRAARVVRCESVWKAAMLLQRAPR